MIKPPDSGEIKSIEKSKRAEVEKVSPKQHSEEKGILTFLIIKIFFRFYINPFPPRLEAYFILFLYFYNEFINK